MTWPLGFPARGEYAARSTRPAGPVAYFESSPEDPAAGDSVRFDAGASADIAGRGLSYAWDFGDGSTGAGVTASHNYRKAGWYDAKLVVTDAKGNSSGY